MKQIEWVRELIRRDKGIDGNICQYCNAIHSLNGGYSCTKREEDIIIQRAVMCLDACTLSDWNNCPFKKGIIQE